MTTRVRVVRTYRDLRTQLPPLDVVTVRAYRWRWFARFMAWWINMGGMHIVYGVLTRAEVIEDEERIDSTLPSAQGDEQYGEAQALHVAADQLRQQQAEQMRRDSGR